jgi:hypothetical protein
MAKFMIDMQVSYSFEVEAEDAKEAEELAWDYNYSDDHSAYQGVYSIDVEEMEDEEDGDE